MRGFVVYAIPTWSPAYDDLFPAMIRYTGTDDVAICYQYRILDGKLTRDIPLDTIPTWHGSFFQLSAEMIGHLKMIRVEDGDYVAHVPDVATMSSMMQMVGTEVVNPSLQGMNKLFEKVAELWRIFGLSPK
jgi:hypothetical protein